MEYNFYILGSCSRIIWAHFEVNIMVVSHAIQKLYPIYPRYQRGGYHPLSFSTIAYSFFFLEEKQIYHSVEGMQGYICLLTYLSFEHWK